MINFLEKLEKKKLNMAYFSKKIEKEATESLFKNKTLLFD